MPENKATNFEFPPSIEALLDRLASMLGLLATYVKMRANRLSEDSATIAFRLFELWGIMQAVSFLYGSVCQDKVQEVLETYRNLSEIGLEHIHGKALSKEDIEDINDMLFRLKVATIMLMAGCAGLPAIVKAPSEPSTEASGR